MEEWVDRSFYRDRASGSHPRIEAPVHPYRHNEEITEAHLQYGAKCKNRL